jgi:hypothetical protein
MIEPLPYFACRVPHGCKFISPLQSILYVETHLFTFNPVSYKLPAIPTILPDTVSLTVEVLSSQSLKLSWSSVSEAQGYSLERKAGGELFQKLTTLSADINSYVDEGLQRDLRYTYRLKSSSGEILSKGKDVSVTINVLDNPTNFSAVSKSPDAVELSWAAPAGATGYLLKRAVGSGNYEFLTQLNKVLTFRDTNLLPKTTYRYKLIAFNNLSRSSGSEISVITLPPIIPDTTYIQGDARSSTVIELQWLEVFGAIAYKVERKTETGNFSEVASLPASTTTFKDAGLIPDTIFTYRVRTETADGLSKGAEIVRQTHDDKAWRTPIEVQRDSEITPAFVTPIPGKGAVFGEYGDGKGTGYTPRYVSFIDSDGNWGTSDLFDFPVSYPLASNSQGEVVASGNNTWNKLYVKRYSENTGWGETEQINSPENIDYITWSSVTLGNNSTIHLLWQLRVKSYGQSLRPK